MEPVTSEAGVPETVAAANRSAIARKVGMSLSGVSRILSGNRVARSTNLKEIALVLGIPMDDLYEYLMEVRRKRLARVRPRKSKRRPVSSVA